MPMAVMPTALAAQPLQKWGWPTVTAVQAATPMPGPISPTVVLLLMVAPMQRVALVALVVLTVWRGRKVRREMETLEGRVKRNG